MSSPITAARVSRTKCGSITIAIAYIAFVRPGPRIATTATASSRLGSASMMSISRMIVNSTPPRKKPATSPSTTPKLSDRPTETMPISSDSRVPWISRESWSRPTGSVPSTNTWPPIAVSDGAFSTASGYCSRGEYGAITSASSAASTSAITTARPIIAPRLRRKSRQSSSSGDGGAPTRPSPPPSPASGRGSSTEGFSGVRLNSTTAPSPACGRGLGRGSPSTLITCAGSAD